jgi:hypothetical protein
MLARSGFRGRPHKTSSFNQASADSPLHGNDSKEVEHQRSRRIPHHAGSLNLPFCRHLHFDCEAPGALASQVRVTRTVRSETLLERCLAASSCMLAQKHPPVRRRSTQEAARHFPKNHGGTRAQPNIAKQRFQASAIDWQTHPDSKRT